ncbi:putative ATP-dependent RNA helicase kurz-like protein, partial [Dinothrombium tinctorium]
IELEVDSSKYDECNQLVLPSKKSKQNSEANKQMVESKPKKLSKKKRKKLEKILKRKQLIEDRKTIIAELKKYQIPSQEYEKMSSVNKMQTRGLKRIFADTESASSSEKLKRLKSVSGGKNNEADDFSESKDPNIIGFERSENDDDDASEDEDDDNNESCEKEVENLSNPETSSKSEIQNVHSVKSTENEIENVDSSNKAKSEESNRDKLIDENKATEKREKLEKTSEPAVFVPIHRLEIVEKARLSLPILAEEQIIMEAIRYNPVVIICGETGSGKTTQVPQFLYEAGYSKSQKIAITEPRRVAAINMSKRVAYEMNVSGDIVSYQIRFDGNISPETKICYMTDGVLLREVQKDFLLSSFSVIIIDEAHERSLYSDILIGLLSRIVPLRYKKGSPLHLIIMSATLRIEDFTRNSNLFKTEPRVLKVSSRQYSVTIHFSKRTPEDYIHEAYLKVCSIHQKYPEGGILIFVTGQQEVNALCAKIRRTYSRQSDKKNYIVHSDKKNCEKSNQNTEKTTKRKPKRRVKTLSDLMPIINLDNYQPLSEASDSSDLSENEDVSEQDIESDLHSLELKPIYCLPLYAKLPENKQALVFEPPPEGSRLCIVATNVAETSLTIPNIKYVVDTGKVKSKVYDKVTGISTMIITWTSKASANQRAGRAGRVSNGHCFRLYSSSVFKEQFPEFSDPEICTKPVDDLVLQMKSMNIDNVCNFPFPTPPSSEALKASEQRLMLLGALDDLRRETHSLSSIKSQLSLTKITPLGKAMAYFPLNPRYAKMLVLAAEQDFLCYAIAIISALTIQHIFIDDCFSVEESEESSIKSVNQNWKNLRKKWAGVGNSLLLGDVMVLLKAVGASEFVNCSPKLMEKYGLRYKAMVEIHKLRRQLTASVNALMVEQQLSLNLEMEPPTDVEAKLLRQLMLSGLFDHVAKRIPEDELPESHKKFKNCYKSIETESIVHLPQTSALYELKPEMVIYQEIYETTRLYMRNVVAIEPEWLPKFAPRLCTFSKPLENPPPRYNKATDQVLCHVTAVFGAYAWQIPQTEIEFPYGVEKIKWFAKFVLEGEVLPFFSQYKALLLSSPSIMVKSWAKLQPRTEEILSALLSKKCDSRTRLELILREEPSYLLSEYCKWLPEEKIAEVKQKWNSVFEEKC